MRYLTLYTANTAATPSDAQHREDMGSMIEDMARMGVLVQTGALAKRATGGASVTRRGGAYDVALPTADTKSDLMAGTGFAILEAASREEVIEQTKRFLAAAGDGHVDLIEMHQAPIAAAQPNAGVVPYLALEGALKASEFYQRAFGAEVLASQPPDDKGRTMHVHLRVNGGSLMLSDCFPEYGHSYEPPQGFTLHQQVRDIDPAWKRAVDAGCTIAMPLGEMFWGDRYGQLRDPFGVLWSIGQAK